MTIELATPQEHLDGANYIVTINSSKDYPADTEEEAWRIIGERRFGSCYMVTSPVGLDCSDFVPY